MVRLSFWGRLLDLISPRLCVVCGHRLTVSERCLCSRCNMHLPRTGFQHDAYGNVMARLLWGQIPVERVAALFYYEAGSETARMIYELKYHDQPEVGEELGRMTAREFALAGFFEGIDALIPVPLARRRQRQRGYNQSKMVARGVSAATGLPIFDRVARRTVFEKSQTKMGRWERIDNVKDVFEVRDGSTLNGKHILLIDDVMTTGATVISCARELQKAANVRISVLTLGFAKN